MNVPEWVWWVTIAATVAIFVVDIAIVGRRPHEPSRREVTVALSIYIGMAILFGIGVWTFSGAQYGTEFFAGWLTEYSLSVDNLFIFIIIMSRLGVPRQYQQEALLIGIVLALIFRGIFIAVGAAAINNFSWVFYVFGAFLIYTGYKLAKQGPEDEDEYEENRLVTWTRTVLPHTDDYRGGKLWLRENGKFLFTPMFAVIVALGTIERLVYLSYGLAFLLAFIGVKLVLHAMHENELPFINGGEHVEWAPEIPIWLSLGVIVVTLAVTAALSLWASARQSDSERDAHTGPRRDGHDD
jgi:tellurite resistance protein TerC